MSESPIRVQSVARRNCHQMAGCCRTFFAPSALCALNRIEQLVLMFPDLTQKTVPFNRSLSPWSIGSYGQLLLASLGPTRPEFRPERAQHHPPASARTTRIIPSDTPHTTY